jgi:hypothetical protein
MYIGGEHCCLADFTSKILGTLSYPMMGFIEWWRLALEWRDVQYREYINMMDHILSLYQYGTSNALILLTEQMKKRNSLEKCAFLFSSSMILNNHRLSRFLYHYDVKHLFINRSRKSSYFVTRWTRDRRVTRNTFERCRKLQCLKMLHTLLGLRGRFPSLFSELRRKETLNFWTSIYLLIMKRIPRC